MSLLATAQSLWMVYIPGVVIVLAGALIFRWLFALQKRVNDQAERIARLEGRRDLS